MIKITKLSNYKYSEEKNKQHTLQDQDQLARSMQLHKWLHFLCFYHVVAVSAIFFRERTQKQQFFCGLAQPLKIATKTKSKIRREKNQKKKISKVKNPMKKRGHLPMFLYFYLSHNHVNCIHSNDNH